MPNNVLQELLTEARWTQDRLARQVNALGGEIGLSLSLDRRTVSHWLAGRRPRPPLPDLIAESLSRRLGRPLSAAALGLAAPAGDGSGPGAAAGSGPAGRRARAAPDPLRALEQLSELAESGRESELGGAYSLAELAVRPWSAASAGAAPAHHRGAAGAPLEPAHVSGAESMARLFADSDSFFGGGHARTALARYLACYIAPRLRAPGSRALRSRMLAVAAELTRLCGAMCFDDERHALAQRYYLAALRLAVANGDPVGYAATLGALSAQAHALGHHEQARCIAQTALAGAADGELPPSQQADLHAQLAVAAAAHGDRAAALDALASARLLQQAGAAGERRSAVQADHEAAVRTLLGDLPGGIRVLSESIRRRPPQERRERAISLAHLAGLHLDQGHLDESIAVCHAFIDDYAHLHSARARSALHTLVARLRPHSAHHAARQLLARAAAVHPGHPTRQCSSSRAS
jgi:hypothetical protein